MSRRIALAALLATALAGAAPEPAAARLRLADGRVLFGRAIERGKTGATLETVFGRLAVPKTALPKSGTAPPSVKPAPTGTRIFKTRWLEIENDLSPERERLYADQLDPFFDWMITLYALDRDRVRRDALYKMRVFKRRRDFKELQAEIAPGIEDKGQAFAEGVAGFYSPGHGKIFMWDAEGARGGLQLEVAKHETAHLLNHLMSRQNAVKLPTWFEEGSATYFSMVMPLPGKKPGDPEDHPGALAQVIGDIEGKNAYEARALRSVAWNKFHGREYSWGWSLVRFFRRHKNGKRWPALLKHLRTVGTRGPVTDSEQRRFLKAAGFRDSEAFDKAWHAHVLEAKPAGRSVPIGTSPEVLAKIAAIEKPPADLARHFARTGVSLARARETAPAIVYLKAALRGGVKDPDVPYHLAVALAEGAGLAADDPWPREAVDALRLAVEFAPLRAAYRLGLARQLLATQSIQPARDMAGLALVVAGPDDDRVEIALALLRAATASKPDANLQKTVEELAAAVPTAAAALRLAMVYHLQESEDWEALVALLELRSIAGGATRQERAMLAGLYKASDRFEEAETLYAALLREDPSALRLWPNRIECLLHLEREAEARNARKHALEAIAKDPRDLSWLRRRLDRIFDGR